MRKSIQPILEYVVTEVKIISFNILDKNLNQLKSINRRTVGP